MQVGSQLYLQKSAQWMVLAIVITIPMVFGAVHPLLTGLYSFIMLVGLGGWLLLNLPHYYSKEFSLLGVIPLLLLFYIFVQSIPLPLDIVEFLSPHRAERVSMINLLAETDHRNISLSENGIAGMYKALFLFGILLYYYSVKKLLQTNRTFLNTLVLCIVAVGVFEALYGLIQFVSPQIGILWLSVKGRAAHGTIIYKNQYASLVNMIWPLAVASSVCFFIITRKKSGKKKKKETTQAVMSSIANTKIQAVLCLFASGAMWLAVLFSLSQGGILAMIFVALGILLMFPFPLRKKLIFFFGFIVFVCSYGAILGLETVVSRFNAMGSSGGARLDIYVSSIPLLIDHWLTGIGVGAYTLLSPVYLKGFPENIHFDRVHSEYIELVIELGVPMALLLFGWIVLGVANISQSIMVNIKRISVDQSSVLIGTSAFCGLIGFLIHGAVDFGWRLPANLVYATTLLAIVVNCFEHSQEQDEKIGIGSSCER